MTIPFVDLKAQMAAIRPEIDRRIAAVLDHGRFIMGPEVGELEECLAARAGVRHAVGCSSGTDALLLALMAKGIGPGDAVLIPAFTFPATAEVVRLIGAVPVFVDVDETSFNIDPADAESRLQTLAKRGGPTPKALIAVDLYGLPADYPALRPLCVEHGLLLIGDAAQSFGGALDGVRVGALADVTAVSFFPAKPLGCYGDGGAVLTDDGELADLCRSLRMHGQGEDKYDILRVGLNARLDTLQAAILLAKLDIFDDELAARDRVAAAYRDGLPSWLETPQVPAAARSAWAQFTVKTGRRDALSGALRQRGVPTMVYYPRPLHLQPAYTEPSQGEGSVPRAERLCEQVLSLPMHPYLDDPTIAMICRAVQDAGEATAAAE